jgi:hypothetical protein
MVARASEEKCASRMQNAECRMQIHDDSIVISGCETRHLWSKHITLLLLEARDCAWHVIHHIDGMYGGSYRFLHILLTAIERLTS